MATTNQDTTTVGAVDRGLAFLKAQNDQLECAWVEHLWRGGPASAVVDALSAYQNEDGGFGKGLEVDIKAPVSNPFATRLAMHVLVTLREPIDGPLLHNLERWLIDNQNTNGDWQFAPEVYHDGLAPWFAGWTFTTLNPAGCLAGLAARLHIGNEELQRRVRTLFEERASLDEARTGEFYDLLPYVEYFGGVEHPERDAYLDAIATNIITTADKGGYPDAGHFFDHVLAVGDDLSRRLPNALMASQRARLLAEQEGDGGWPTPYDEAWRSWVTASALKALAELEQKPKSS